MCYFFALKGSTNGPNRRRTSQVAGDDLALGTTTQAAQGMFNMQRGKKKLLVVVFFFATSFLLIVFSHLSCL